MSPTATLLGSDALSTAFRPLTPVAPAADVLMPSAAGAQRLAPDRRDDRRRGDCGARGPGCEHRGRCQSGIACAPEDAAAALGLAVGDDAVEDVTNGPLKSEQPLLHAVALSTTL